MEVIDNEGLIALSDITYAFLNCVNLVSANIVIDTITPYINYFNMWYAFHNCSNLQNFPTIIHENPPVKTCDILYDIPRP